MAEDTFSVGALYVRQVKDSSFERGPSGAHDQEVELPGFLELCADVNGVPWVVARRKAPGLLADIARKQAEGSSGQAEPTPTPTPTPTAAQSQ